MHTQIIPSISASSSKSHLRKCIRDTYLTVFTDLVIEDPEKLHSDIRLLKKKSISLRSVGSQKIGAPKISIVPNYAVKWLPLVYSTCKTLFWKIPFVYFPTGKITCCFDDL